MTKTLINQDVAVTAVSFRKDFETVPKRIEYRGVTYSFIGAGMRYLISTGERKTRLFDMTDGSARFRLRNEAGAPNWTLVAITQ